MEWAWLRKVARRKQEDLKKGVMQMHQQRMDEKELEGNVIYGAASDEEEDQDDGKVEQAAPKGALGVVGGFIKGISGFSGASATSVDEDVPEPAAEAGEDVPEPDPPVDREHIQSLVDIVESDALMFTDEEDAQRFVVAALVFLRLVVDDEESRMMLGEENNLERVICTISEKAAGTLQEIGFESWQTIDKLINELLACTGFEENAIQTLNFLDDYFSFEGMQNPPIVAFTGLLLQFKEKLFRIWPRLLNAEHRPLIHRIQGEWQKLLEVRAPDIQKELAEVAPILSTIVFRAGFLDYVPYALGAGNSLEPHGKVFSDWHLSHDDWNPYMDDKYDDLKDVLEVVYDYALADAITLQIFQRKDTEGHTFYTQDETLKTLRRFAQRLYHELRGHAPRDGHERIEGLFELLDHLPIKDVQGQTWYVTERAGNRRFNKAILQVFDDLSAAEVKELARHKDAPYMLTSGTARGTWPAFRNACVWVSLVKDMLEERGIPAVGVRKSASRLKSEETALSEEAGRVLTKSKGPKVLASTASKRLFGAKRGSSAFSSPNDTSMPDAPVNDTQGPAHDPASRQSKIKGPRNYEERVAPQTGEVWYTDHPAHFPFAETPFMVAVQSRQVTADLRRGSSLATSSNKFNTLTIYLTLRSSPA